MSGVHDGHRQRLKRRFIEHGLDDFDAHNVLEILLFFVIPRGDVNPLAHELIDHFGSLSAVFDAPIEELTKLPGVGESTATLIKLIPQVARQYMISRATQDHVINDSRSAGEYLLPYFYGERDEVVFIVCLDIKGKVLCCKRLFRGSVNSAHVNMRKVVETALTYNSTSVIIAHNHPSGVAIPSDEDKATTARVADALKAVDIKLNDHIVVADDDYVSFKDNGFLHD